MLKWLKRIMPAFIIAAFVTGGMVAAFELRLLQGAEQRIFNAKLRVRGQLPQTGKVVIATIDNYSVMPQNLGRWPWPRSYMGMLVDTLDKYGAKVIAFDAFFPEPYENVPLEGMRRYLRSHFERLKLDRPVFSKKNKRIILKRLREFYDYYLGAEFVRNPEKKEEDEVEQALNPDYAFAKALARHDNIVLGYYFDEPHSPTSYLDELNHAYRIVVAEYEKGGVALPAWFEEDKKKITDLLKNLETREKRHEPYESLMRYVSDFAAEFEKHAKNAKEHTKTYTEPLEAVVSDFYAFCMDDLLGKLNRDMAYLVENPPEDIREEIEKSFSGMETSVIKYDSAEGAVNPFFHAFSLTPNIPLFTMNCKHFGHVFVKPDPDGVIRNHYPAIYYGKRFFPSLSVQAASMYLEKPLKIILHERGRPPELKIGNTNLPLDENGRLLINYLGPKDYPLYSIYDIIYGSLYDMPAPESIPAYFQEVLGTTPEDYYRETYGKRPRRGDIEAMLTDVVIDGEPLANRILRWESESFFQQRYGLTPKQAFDGKIVLIGATATGIYDLRVTPFSENTPGVEIHAQVVDSILKGDFLESPVWARTYSFALMVSLALVLAVILPLIGAVRGAILTIMLLGAILGVDYFYFFLGKGYWLPISYQSIQLGAMFLLITIYRYATEEREKRFIKDTFGKYLAPSVVEHLTRNPELLKLGGDELELTAFFSDIQGFSTISEQLGSAELLVELLNDYLSEMAQVIEAYEGTIDKYEGDAIIAFWGAPLRFPDHALKACYACLDQQAKLAELREKWRREGKWPEIAYTAKVRMGLNTGPMVVGNMGSMGRMNYTVMGDAVNLASRLEGANKTYGTYIMISEDTYAQVREHVEVRELDRLRVVGKTEPVRVYELLARKGKLDPYKQRVVELFLEALEAYKRMEWQKALELFQTVLNIDPEDMPTRAYVARCKQYMIVPPPGDWDGVFTLTTK